MVVDPKLVEEIIVARLPDAHCQIKEYSGGGDHFQVLVVSEAFQGLSSLKRHRLIMELFDHLIQTKEVHALSLKTLTPNEAKEVLL